MSPSSTRNLLIFTTVRSIWAVTFGLIGPFYVVYVASLSGGMEKLGIAFSIMVLFQSLTSYLAGHFSDKLGRRPFLIVTAYVDTTILFLYTVIHETYQLYLLQGMLGITNGVIDTISTSLLGDLTIKEKRGKDSGQVQCDCRSFISDWSLFRRLYGQILWNQILVLPCLTCCGPYNRPFVLHKRTRRLSPHFLIRICFFRGGGSKVLRRV